MRLVHQSALALLLVASGAPNTQHKAAVASRVANLRSATRCADSSKIRITVPDAKLSGIACWLVGQAVQEIGSGIAEHFGFPAADTALVTAATLPQFKFTGRLGANDEWYWLVTLSVAGKNETVDVYVYIDQFSPAVRVYPTEVVSTHP